MSGVGVHSMPWQLKALLMNRSNVDQVTPVVPDDESCLIHILV